MTTPDNRENYEMNLREFLNCLEVINMEPTELCNTWGNYNVAWELVTDMKRSGNFIIANSCNDLTEHQKSVVTDFIISLNQIPEPLLISATTIEDNQAAMNDPCWIEYRSSASKLLKDLEPCAITNREYFS